MKTLRSLQQPPTTSLLVIAVVFLTLVGVSLKHSHGPRVIRADFGTGCGTSGVRWIEFRAFDSNGTMAIEPVRYGEEGMWDPSPGTRAYFETADYSRYEGLLAPTSLVMHVDIRPMSIIDANWTPADELEWRDLLSGWLDTQGDSRAASMIRTNQISVRRALIIGYLIDTLWLGLVALTLYSCGWLVDARRERLGKKRFRRGQCPACAYPFAGLPSPICPECGERLLVSGTATG